MFKHYWPLAVLLFACPVGAQVNTVLFDTSAPGVSRAITNWGVDTGATTYDDVYRTLLFMGPNTVNMVQLAFTMDEPLTNNDIFPNDQAYFANMVSLASMTSTNARWIMSSGTGNGVNSYYISGANTVYPDRWAATMEAWQRDYSADLNHRSMLMAQPFNEPDYGPWNQGSQQNLYDIMGYLQASTNFAGVRMGGGCTLNCDNATSWYDAIAGRASIGTTHCLGGSVAGYVNFIQTVLANNATPIDPEMHNLGEAIIGANYGLEGGIYWLTVELARGSFANACQGQQLGYADDWANWSAAAVYRGTNGTVQAFIGGSERQGVASTYRLFSHDRSVFYNGYGPQRDFTVNNPGNGEQVMNITWGADAQPPISGRYIIANRFSQKVMEVPGASTNNGVVLDQTNFSGGSNQMWDIYPVPPSFGGDISYYSMTAAHDGLNADESNYSYTQGNPIIQYAGGTNTVEQWYFQYAGNGYFYIRSRWSGEALNVSSSSAGAKVVQWASGGLLSEQWRLIPAGNPVAFAAPATPTGLGATPNAASILLNWNTNSGPTPVSYTVLQATNSTGPYFIVARGLTNNVFTDNSANQVQPYYYVVEAVDGSVNTSAYSAQASATPTGSPSLVAQYHLDGNVLDSSVNGNNATLTGTPNYVAGMAGPAITMDGLANYIEMPAGMFNLNNFTIAAWVYWNGGVQWQRIFDCGNGTGQYLFLTPDSGNGTLRFAITTGGPGAEQRVETSSPMASNQWVHVAITYDGNVCDLYTNGVLAASGGITISPASFNPALNYLGKSQFSGDPLFSGNLDEVLVANYAMDGSQIASLLINQAPLPTLVHRYSFSETGGTVADDTIGGAAWNGTLPNGGTFSGGQLTLSSASSQYVQLPAGILSNYTAVTIDSWVTFPDQAAWNTMFFGFGNTISGGGDDYIFCAPQSGRIAITSTNFTGEQNAYSGIDFSFHTNLHVTAVYDPPQNFLEIYTNGVPAGFNGGITTPLSAVNDIFSYIGRSLYTGDVYFDCTLDEFRIYNGAMQPADVAASQLVGPNVLLSSNISLATTPGSGNLSLSWPVASPGFTLESSPTLGAGAVWTPFLVAPQIVGSNYQITVTPTSGTVFFRLLR